MVRSRRGAVHVACLGPSRRVRFTNPFTRSGQVHGSGGRLSDDRGLKHGAENDTRSVPIPPELVTILREHTAEGVGFEPTVTLPPQWFSRASVAHRLPSLLPALLALEAGPSSKIIRGCCQPLPRVRAGPGLSVRDRGPQPLPKLG
jgi:hypothetical protein